MSINNPFDILNNINSGSNTLIDEWDENIEKAYVPFMINRGLSYHLDTVLIANAANQMAHADKKAQYRFLKSIVRPKKRYGKWAKAETSELINKVTEAFQCSRKEAEAYLKLLTEEQLTQIKSLTEGGQLK